MVSNEHIEDWDAKLHQSVDALAVKLLMEEEDGQGGSVPAGTSAPDGIVEALTEIAELARRAGSGEAAEISAGLIEKITANPGTSSREKEEPGSSLANGIQRLQQAIANRGKLDAGDASETGHGPPSLGQDPELLADFVLEAGEHLANIEKQMIALERNPTDLDCLHSAFRGFHTIKGLAGFLDLEAIQEVAHRVETILDRARNEEVSITPPVIDIVLDGADYLKQAVCCVEAGLHDNRPTPAPDNRKLVERIAAVGSSREEAAAPPREQHDTSAPASKAAPAPSGGYAETGTVKIGVGKVDHLVDMVGELVVAQSLLRHDPSVASAGGPRLQRNLSQLSRITTDIQRTAMSMRMVPVGRLFQRMARLVRDLSRKEGKQVELVTSGEDTELDRNIVEELADPLMHMVRNAIGHGLETPAEREEAGKSPTGRISLSAFHQSGFVMIELGDDGRGLNRQRILERAVKRGLVEKGASLPDSEIDNLIFEPGFSTAAKVDGVSGRGVGMDVVKRNIMKLRGRVEIRSAEGSGTTFLLKLPLTLAIIDGLVVGVGRERYIAPIYTVREMLRPKPEALSALHDMVMVRGRLLPLVRLYRRFGVKPRSENPVESLLLVAETLGKSFCLMVDELIGKQEVVIKSLGETLRSVPGVAGGAILGNGRVGLILDMDSLFETGSEN